MCLTQKINATNTWNFALIDYFHDMSLLRSESGDGSINFQKASCTLDGCVKVWTSRVDSVMAETGRLLSGLQDENENLAQKEGGAQDDAASDEGEGDDEEGARTTRKRTRAREATLAKSFAQLQAKRFDLEFTVDPLFKKTSADFDEGGAGGLLMNHLHVDNNMKVVFDASDVTGDAGEGGEGGGEAQGEAEASTPTPNGDASHAEASMSAADTSAADTSAADTSAADTSAADTSANSPADSRADMSVDSTTPDPTSSDTPLPLDLEPLRATLQAADAGAPLESVLASRILCPSLASFTFSDGNEAELPLLQDLEEQEAMMDLPDLDMAMDTDDQYDPPELDFFEGPDAIGADDERDFDVAFAHPTDESAPTPSTQGGHDVLFDYFDNRMKKNWAGPEHWKMSRLNLASAQRERRAESAAPESERPRRRKEAQTIDFFAEDAKPMKELFAPSATPASISMTKAAKADTSAHLLPEDQHFNSKRLLRLFLKPKATILLQQKRAAAHDDVEDAWANEENDFVPDLFQDVHPYEDVLPAAPFDAPPELDGFADESDDEILRSDALRRVRPEYVEHAKRAKQIDVKRLKDNIWQNMDVAPAEPTPFGNVLSTLHTVYPKQKLEEISTSFCFICLLHLANEEGLALAVPGGEDDDALGAPDDDAHVGRIDLLQVRRDPALASAS